MAERRLWLRWVAANAGGELLGLGAAALAGVALTTTLPPGSGLALATAVVVLGAVEGAVVGATQWNVLRRPLTSLDARIWVGATALGTSVAWALGMGPSLLLGGDAGAPAPGFDDATPYALTAVFGVVPGPVLALPQWVVLRRYVARAYWWVPANAVAWACGMPVVFLGASNAPPGPLGSTTAGVLASVAAAGAVVGAVHGVALVRLLR